MSRTTMEAVGEVALKQVAIIAMRAPWDLPPHEAQLLAGYSPAEIAQGAVAQLAAGTGLEFGELGDLCQPPRAIAGMIDYAESLLTRDRRGLDREHDWAYVVGEHHNTIREHRMTIVELRQAVEDERRSAAMLRDLLRRCLPILETSDALQASKLFHDVRRTLGE